MAGKQASLRDLTGEKRQKFEGSLEFGTHLFVGQALYAKDPAAAFYDRQEKVLRNERERALLKIPARSPNLE
jgi:hypothetical protein